MSNEANETDFDLNTTTSKPKTSIKSQFSLQNGKVFQKIFENPSDYGLTKSDQEVLLDGRNSMITYTRLGFLIGAMISPLPLFYKSKHSIKSFPPLILKKTNQPNLNAIKSRIWWISKSVILTTFGSALGSWFGFYFGLKNLNQKIDKEIGFRDRFENALEKVSNRIQSGSGVIRRGESGVRDENQEGKQEIEKDLNNLGSDFNSIILNSTKSRWEELRKEKLSKPSTWDEIREKHYKSLKPINEFNQTSSSPRIINQDEMNLNSKEIQKIEFENLLENERKFCNQEDQENQK